MNIYRGMISEHGTHKKSQSLRVRSERLHGGSVSDKCASERLWLSPPRHLAKSHDCSESSVFCQFATASKAAYSGTSNY